MSDISDTSDVSEDPGGQPREVEDLVEDPKTGSTPEAPQVDESGLPPAGDDPMGGEAPSG